MIRCSELMVPLINLLHEKAQPQPVVHLDETVLQVLRESGRSAERSQPCLEPERYLETVLTRLPQAKELKDIEAILHWAISAEKEVQKQGE